VAAGKTASDVLTGTTIHPRIVHNDNYNGNRNYGCQSINNAELDSRFLVTGSWLPAPQAS